MKFVTSAILILVGGSRAAHTSDGELLVKWCRAADSFCKSNNLILHSAIKEKYVTCGSTIKLAHIESGGKFFLMSDERQLQSGSGQQLVTAVASADSHNALWQIREADGAPACDIGKPIKCGDIIRFTHLNTNNNLHTHGIKSPLSKQHEVTGFGNGQGEGDKGDDWRVMCSSGEEYWLRDEEVSFRSSATSRYLGSASNAKFTEQNCGRGCPSEYACA